MDVYIVSMWLTCNRNDDVTLAAFDDRFTRAIEGSWASFVIEKDAVNPLAKLATALNQEIWDKCQTSITIDVPGASAVVALSSTSWTPGTGGQHEANVGVMLTEDANTVPWQFDAGPGSTRIYVQLHWDERTVTS